MSIVKYISTGKIIADFYRDVNPSNSNWIYNAIEWIGVALEELGGSYHTEIKKETLQVVNHRVNIPCNIESIQQIIYNGKILFKYNTINISDENITDTPFWNTMDSYEYIRFSFITGEIIIYYYSLSTEYIKELGIETPIIPSDGTNKVRNFLQEFILMKYLARGNKHPIRNYREVKQGIYSSIGLLQQAKNAIKFPSPTDLDAIGNVINKWYTDMDKRAKESFNDRNTVSTSKVTAVGIYTNSEGFSTEIQ